jgi:hypothetical protein
MENMTVSSSQTFFDQPSECVFLSIRSFKQTIIFGPVPAVALGGRHQVDLVKQLLNHPL